MQLSHRYDATHTFHEPIIYDDFASFRRRGMMLGILLRGHECEDVFTLFCRVNIYRRHAVDASADALPCCSNMFAFARINLEKRRVVGSSCASYRQLSVCRREFILILPSSPLIRAARQYVVRRTAKVDTSCA